MPAHQALDPAAGCRRTLAGRMDLADVVQQRPALGRALAFGARAPGVAARHRHPEHAAHQRHGPAAAMVLDDPEPHRDGAAKMTIPFSRISRSMRSCSTSRFSRAISAQTSGFASAAWSASPDPTRDRGRRGPRDVLPLFPGPGRGGGSRGRRVRGLPAQGSGDRAGRGNRVPRPRAGGDAGLCPAVPRQCRPHAPAARGGRRQPGAGPAPRAEPGVERPGRRGHRHASGRPSPTCSRNSGTARSMAGRCARTFRHAEMRADRCHDPTSSPGACWPTVTC